MCPNNDGNHDGPAMMFFSKNGYAFSNNPSTKMMADRRTMARTTIRFSSSSRRDNERCVVIPTSNRKNGNTRSANVQPFQALCLNGANTCVGSPGSLTNNMPAIVKPRSASMEMTRAG